MWKVHTTNGSSSDPESAWDSQHALSRSGTRSENLSDALGHRKGTSIGTNASSNKERKDVSNHLVDVLLSRNDKFKASEGVAKKESVRSIVIRLCNG